MSLLFLCSSSHPLRPFWPYTSIELHRSSQLYYDYSPSRRLPCKTLISALPARIFVRPRLVTSAPPIIQNSVGAAGTTKVTVRDPEVAGQSIRPSSRSSRSNRGAHITALQINCGGRHQATLTPNSQLSALGGSTRLCTIAVTPARLAEADA